MSEPGARTRANAVITAHKYEPASYEEPAEGPVLARIHVEESFSGDAIGMVAIGEEATGGAAPAQAVDLVCGKELSLLKKCVPVRSGGGDWRFWSDTRHGLRCSRSQTTLSFSQERFLVRYSFQASRGG